MRRWNFWCASRRLLALALAAKLCDRFTYTFASIVRIKNHILVYALTLALLTPLAALGQTSASGQFKAQIDKA